MVTETIHHEALTHTYNLCFFSVQLSENTSRAHCQDKDSLQSMEARLSGLVRVHTEQKHIKEAPRADALPRVKTALLCSLSSSFSAV